VCASVRVCVSFPQVDFGWRTRCSRADWLRTPRDTLLPPLQAVCHPAAHCYRLRRLCTTPRHTATTSAGCVPPHGTLLPPLQAVCPCLMPQPSLILSSMQAHGPGRVPLKPPDGVQQSSLMWSYASNR
jgi:hypothetical protein